jgi:hypothetical protein
MTFKKRGGAREGAGRPRKHSRPMRMVNLYLPVEIIDELDERAGLLGGSRAEIATVVLELGLNPKI